MNQEEKTLLGKNCQKLVFQNMINDMEELS